MARIYANENFPQPAVEELRKLGHDVLTTADAGMAGQAVSDEDVMKFAIQESRSVLTQNRRHFVKLHAEQRDHPGIIVCSVDRDAIALAARIDREIASLESLDGALIRINRPG